MRLYKATEWENGGLWHAGDTSDLKNDSNAWYIPARLLGLSLEDWILKLKNEFNATGFYFAPAANNGKSVLTYHWKNYADCHRYVLWINRMARNHNWTIQIKYIKQKFKINKP